VGPGETVDLKMTYALLHDAPDTKITVTEISEKIPMPHQKLVFTGQRGCRLRV